MLITSYIHDSGESRGSKLAEKGPTFDPPTVLKKPVSTPNSITSPTSKLGTFQWPAYIAFEDHVAHIAAVG
jgi:hypothetical protein